MPRYVAVLLLSFLLVKPALSQSSNDKLNAGSVYSYFGMGMPYDQTSTQDKAMGIQGVSFYDYNTAGLSNPAFWGIGFFTRGSAEFNYANYSVTDQSTSGSNSNFAVDQIQLVFPLKQQKLGLSVALYPETREIYQVLTSETIYPQPGDTLSYALNKSGRGGITKFEVGLGLRVTRNFSVGYAPSLAFARSTDNETFTFLTGGNVDSQVRSEISGSGFSHRFGMLFRAQSLFRKDDLFQIGGTLNLPYTFQADQENSLIKYVNGVRQETTVGETVSRDISMPLKLAGGISYFPSQLVNFSTEGLYQQWSEAQYGFNAGEEDLLSDRLKFGLGGQYHAYRMGSDRFLSKFKYSAGIAYDTGHLKLQNESINTLWFSTGLSIIPPLGGRSTVDLAFQLGFRGNGAYDAANLAKERIWSISLSVNLGELMFIRPKLR